MLPKTCNIPLVSSDLFVYFSCQTRSRELLLTDDEIQQAAYQAIGIRTRLLLCRLLAIESSQTRLFVVFRFPASLSVLNLAQSSMEAADDAISKLQQILHARPRTGQPFWERDYILETMNPQESTQPGEYLRQRVQEMELTNPGT